MTSRSARVFPSVSGPDVLWGHFARAVGACLARRGLERSFGTRLVSEDDAGGSCEGSGLRVFRPRAPLHTATPYVLAFSNGRAASQEPATWIVLCCLMLVSVILSGRGKLATQTALYFPVVPLSSTAVLDVPSSPEHLDGFSNGEVVPCRVSPDVSDGSSLFKKKNDHILMHSLSRSSRAVQERSSVCYWGKYGTSEEEKSEPICTESATVSRSWDCPRLPASPVRSPHQMGGVDGHQSHEALSIIDGVLVRRFSIPESKASCDNEIQDKSDGWTSGDGSGNMDQNELDGFLPRSADAVRLEVSAAEVEQVKDSIATAASVPATPTSPTDTNKSITHESAACSAARSIDTLFASQPPLLTGATGESTGREPALRRKRKVGKASFKSEPMDPMPVSKESIQNESMDDLLMEVCSNGAV